MGYAYNDLGGGVCGCNSCSDCSDALNNNTNCYAEVRLTTDITGWTGTCVDNPENFSNKIFDCQGHVIDGDRSGIDYGIYLNGKENNTIRNCNVSDYIINLYIRNSTNNTIVNISAYQSLNFPNSASFSIASNSTNNTIVNSSSYSSDYGFMLGGSSSYNKLINNKVSVSISLVSLITITSPATLYIT